MKQKRSPKKPNIYFTQETENAIVLYNSMEDDIQRNIIYTKKIHPAFYKLAEIMIHRFKFYNFDVGHEDVKHEVVSFLHEKIHKYTPLLDGDNVDAFIIAALDKQSVIKNI